MDKIKFANGAVYDCASISTAPYTGFNKAIIALANITFAEAAAIFSDPNLTQEIEWGNYRLIGYTNLVAMSVESYGSQAILTGGHNERIS